MGRGSSTGAAEKHSQQAWWLVRALHSSLVPATTLEGMRKVKHLMVNMAPVPDNAGPIYWAIVYVLKELLQAFSTSTQQQWQTCMNPTSSSANCGIVDPTAGPIRFSSPVSRNLNNGDSIAPLLRQTSTNTMGVDGTVRLRYHPHQITIAPIEIKHAYTLPIAPSGRYTNLPQD